MGKRIYISILDDYGERVYTVSSYNGGIFNFYQRDFWGNKLRYNQNEERIEVYNAEKGFWDVHSQYLYNVTFTTSKY